MEMEKTLTQSGGLTRKDCWKSTICKRSIFTNLFWSLSVNDYAKGDQRSEGPNQGIEEEIEACPRKTDSENRCVY